jgi:hypothetical protein
MNMKIDQEMATDEFLRLADSWHLDDANDIIGDDAHEYHNFVMDVISAIKKGRFIISREDDGQGIVVIHKLLQGLGSDKNILELTYKMVTVADMKKLDKVPNGESVGRTQTIVACMANMNVAVVSTMLVKDINIAMKLYGVFFAD